MRNFNFLSALLSLPATTLALNNGFGRTPPLGFNSWYSVRMSPSATDVFATAAALESSGLQALGYTHVNLDDGIVEVGRDANGDLIPDKTGFPNGFKVVSDALHASNFTFGVYTDRGPLTCGGRAAAQGHEAQDARFYAANGVDYVKEDSCNAPADHQIAFAQYAAMRDGIAASGRPMFFSLCGWESWYSPVLHALGNIGRIGPDDTNWNGVLSDVDDMAPLWMYAGPGAFNDPCLLLGADSRGVDAITEAQSRAQFSLWAVLAAPMLLSQTIVNMTAHRLATYSNQEVIAVGQDILGRQGQRVAGGNVQLARRNLADSLSRRYNGKVPDPRKVLSPKELKAARGVSANDGDPPLTMTTCNAGASQKWSFDIKAPGYLSNTATGLCANADDCGTNIIAYECVTTGGTCCGTSCYDGLKFAINANGSMTTPGAPGQCVTGGGVGTQLSLTPCSSISTQKFNYDTTTQQIIMNDASSSLCVTLGDGSNKTAVFGRPLADGGVALAFLNAGSTSADVSCDIDCLSTMGFEVGQVFTARDLWAQENLPNFVGGITAPALDADGGIAMIKIMPLFNTTLPTAEEL